MEQILEKLGDPGRYHVLIAVMFAITWWSVCLGTVSNAFYGFTPNHTCDIDSSLEHANISHIYQPIDKWNITVSDDQCNFTINSSISVQCDSWWYDDEGRGTHTIVSQYNLVCDDKYKTSLSNTFFFIGVFFGALLFGFISDHLGRKKTLALCLYIQIPISLAISFMPDIISFTVMRFILGVWLQGISTVAFVHCIEFFRQKYRGVVMVGFGMSWAFAQLLAAFFAYVFPDWRNMQRAASAVALITIPYFWWLPESPRWLLVKNRFEEITDVFITRAAKMNNLQVQQTLSWCSRQLRHMKQQQALAASTEVTQSFVNILKRPVLLKRLLAMCFIWCVASMTYYVFIFNTKNLAGNRYLNFAIGAGVEIVVNFGIIFVMTRFGRRKPLLVCCFLVGVFCVISGTIPQKTPDGIDISWVATAFALLGKMSIAAVMCLVFVYAAELFPTFARGGCLALCGCSLRIGGMLAPQIIYLRSVVFVEFPFIFIASLTVVCGILTFFLPETLGRSMPNTIEEAIDMLPEPMSDKSKDMNLLPTATSPTGDSDTSSSITEQEKLTTLSQASQPC